MSDSYNPEALNEQAEQSSEEITFTAEVVKIEELTAKDIFGDDTQSDPDKPMIEVHFETEAGDVITEPFSLPKSPLSWRNPTFKLARFKEAYGAVPEVGQEVNLTVDSNGFLAVDLPAAAE